MSNALEFTLGMNTVPASMAIKGISDDVDAFVSKAHAGGGKLGKFFESFIGGSHEMKATLKVLGEATEEFGAQFGELGEMANLAIGGVNLAIKMLSDIETEAIAHTKEFLVGMASESEHAAEATEEAMSDVASSINQFHDALDASARGQDTHTQAMEQSIQLFREHVESVQASEEAMLKAREAGIDYAHAIGQINDVQAMSLKFNVENQQTLKNSQHTQEKFSQEIAKRRERQADAIKSLPDLEKDYTDRANRGETNKEALLRQQKNLPDLQAQLDKARNEMAQAGAEFKSGGVITWTKNLSAGGSAVRRKNMEFNYNNILGAVQDAQAGIDAKKEIQRQNQAELALIEKKALAEQGILNTYNEQILKLELQANEKKRQDAAVLAARKQEQQIELATAQAKSIADVSKNFAPTSFEKMGFHFGGGGPTLFSDHAAQTAKNTARMAAGIDALVRAVAGNSGLSTDDVRLLGFTQ